MIYALLAIIIVALVVVNLSRKPKPEGKVIPFEPQVESAPERAPEPAQIDKAYKSKWMFTYNEKDFYNKLRAVTDSKNLYLFAKVRLYDLVEPIGGIPNYNTYRNKIQSKHVDFVICNEKLVAKYVIELDDNSHQKPERKDRDIFVTDVLTKCGYKVLHTAAFDQTQIEQFLL